MNSKFKTKTYYSYFRYPPTDDFENDIENFNHYQP